MNTPNLTTFKRWAKDVQPAAKAVLMARVFAELERERVDAYILPIFRFYRFQYSQRWDRTGLIENPEHLYLCDDEIELKAYYEDCDRAHRQHGFTGPHGHCPALTAQTLVVVAENALIDLATPLFGIDHTDLYGENRRKYLELLIGACFAKDAPEQRAHR